MLSSKTDDLRKFAVFDSPLSFISSKLITCLFIHSQNDDDFIVSRTFSRLGNKQCFFCQWMLVNSKQPSFIIDFDGGEMAHNYRFGNNVICIWLWFTVHKDKIAKFIICRQHTNTFCRTFFTQVFNMSVWRTILLAFCNNRHFDFSVVWLFGRLNFC